MWGNTNQTQNYFALSSPTGNLHLSISLAVVKLGFQRKSLCKVPGITHRAQIITSTFLYKYYVRLHLLILSNKTCDLTLSMFFQSSSLLNYTQYVRSNSTADQGVVMKSMPVPNNSHHRAVTLYQFLPLHLRKSRKCSKLSRPDFPHKLELNKSRISPWQSPSVCVRINGLD